MSGDAEILTITGYVESFEPVVPVFFQEENPEAEIGFSLEPTEPLSLVYRDRKAELTPIPFKIFRYIYDRYRSEGVENFDYAEISEAIWGRDNVGRSTISGHVAAIERAIHEIGGVPKVFSDGEFVLVKG